MTESILTHIPINQAMSLLGISKFKFYSLVREGRLKIKKLDKKSFVSVEELNGLFKA